MNEWMNQWMNGWINEWMEWINEWMDELTNGWTIKPIKIKSCIFVLPAVVWISWLICTHIYCAFLQNNTLQS
jgi:hypothetical protein